MTVIIMGPIKLIVKGMIPVKYLGEKSMASFLSGLLKFFWYAGLVFSFFLLATIAVSIAKPNFIVNLITNNAARWSLVLPGLRFTFTSPVLAAQVAPFCTRAICLLVIPGMAVFLYIIRALQAVFSTLINERPFVAANVTNIRKIAIAILFWAVYEGLGLFGISIILLNNISITGVDVSANLTINFSTFVMGLVVLVLAEVFKIGVQLKEDQDLTI